jgi:hypothetical protein
MQHFCRALTFSAVVCSCLDMRYGILLLRLGGFVCAMRPLRMGRQARHSLSRCSAFIQRKTGGGRLSHRFGILFIHLGIYSAGDSCTCGDVLR